MSAVANRFEAALEAVDVTMRRTDPDGFAGAIEAAVVEPAVGAPLGLDDLSLEGTGVRLGPTAAELRAAETGVTAAALGIAEYGTVVIRSRPGGDEPVSLYPPRHVAVLRERDLVADVPAAIEVLGAAFEDGPISAVLATGPSATADMGALVHGVHGPEEVHVLLVTDG